MTKIKFAFDFLVLTLASFLLADVAVAKTLPINDEQIIRALMTEQEAAWNRGDLEAFMLPYWQSSELAFIGKSGIKYGWKNTLDNYQKSYPSRSAMGTLKFTIIQLEVSSDSAFVLGRWSLNRDADNPNGFFTLFWKKLKDQWRIVIDHSS